MKDKNGFIATSILYAFLLAFLTLFLAYTANYLQNKQLINRVQMLAQEELEKYGNVHISDMEIGDYVVFDTMEPEGDGVSSTTTYSSPVNSNAKWILFKIDEGTEGEDGASTPSKYYFVSDITGQITTSYFTSYTGNFDDEGNSITTEMVNGTPITGSLKNVARLFEGNIHYSPSYRKLIGYANASEKAHDFMPIYDYAFPYRLNSGVKVRLMTIKDIEYIKEIDDDKIKAAVINQNSDYALWNPKSGTSEYTSGFDYGWAVYYKQGFSNGGASGTLNGADVGVVNGNCGSNNASINGSTMVYDNSNTSNQSFGKVNSNYVEYCYVIKKTLGSCINSSSSECSNAAYSYKPRLVATIEVVPGEDALDGVADSGNGTLQLPYIISKGVK